MNFRNNRALKVTSTIVLVFFIWTFCGLFEITYAYKNSPQQSAISAQQSKEPKPEEKLQKNIEHITQTIERVKKAKTHKELQGEKASLRQKRQEIEGHDAEIRSQFAETEEKIKGLPDEIRQRHKDFVKKYEENLNILKRNLDEIEKAETAEEVKVEVEKVKTFLEKTKPPSKHKPLDPNKLPHRTPEPVKKEPRLNYSNQYPVDSSYELRVGSKEKANNSSPITRHASPILVASIGDLQGILTNAATQALAPPTAADLAETIEVQFTQQIKDLATQLQNNPVKIYEWVRNNIEFVPTYGSIQGADMCLQTKQCNAFDTASLLIALLRASNIPAKYVYGTIEIPIDKVMNWVGGFTDSMAAINLLASAGIPTKGMVVGSEVKYVQMEHVWVEAYIDYIPSRGARHKTGQGDTWISLDASYKQYNYAQGIDIKSAVPFNAQSFIDQIKSTATINETEGYATNVDSAYIQQAIQSYQTQVQNYITQNYPNATVGDVLGKKEIIKQEFPYLLGTLPYKRIATGARYSELPNSLRHRLTFEIYKDAYDELLGTKITITKTLPELAGKRISLNYVPATDADKNLIDSYVQSYATSVPAYLINLKAELKVDNTVIATGPSLTMGTDQILNLTFTSPTKTEIETHLMVAGDYNVIGLNLGNTKSIFEKRIALNDFSDPVSEMLYQTILGYWTEYDALKDIYAKVYKVATVRLPSEGLSSAPVNIKYVFGTPYTGYYSGKGLDVKRDKEAAGSLYGDGERTKAFYQISGIIGSFFEGAIFDQLFGYKIGDGISAVRILELSNSQGIPIYYVDSSNINTILPNLQISGDVINDIRNAINAGKEVIVPQSNITQKGWTGTGYIVRDPNTGSGGYIIEGGAAGGVYRYEANIQAAMAIGETPYSTGILLAVTSWTQRIGPAVLSAIAGELSIDIPALVATATGALIALTILMLAIIIAVAIDTIIINAPANYARFRHYTTIINKGSILATKIIYASLQGNLDLGPGAYVTDLFLEPDGINGTNTDRLAQELNMPKEKIQTYIELFIDLVRIPLRKGEPPYERQYVYQNMAIIIDGKNVVLIPTP